MKKWKHIIFILLFFSTVVFSHVVFAQDKSYVALSPLPGISDDCVRGDDSGCFEYGSRTSDAGSYLKGMFQLGIGVAAALAVIMITIGGVQYVTSSAFDTKNEGRQRIMYAVGGLILAIASWLILQTINPALLNLDFSKIREGPPAIVEKNVADGNVPQENITTSGIIVRDASGHSDAPTCNTETPFICFTSRDKRWYCGGVGKPRGPFGFSSTERDLCITHAESEKETQAPVGQDTSTPSPELDEIADLINNQSMEAPPCIRASTRCFPHNNKIWFCSGRDAASAPYNAGEGLKCENDLAAVLSGSANTDTSEPSQSGGSADDNTTPPAPDQTQETSDSDTNTSQSGQGSGRYLCFASGGQITVAPFANTSQGRALCNAERSRHRSEGKATSVCFSRSSPPSASGCPAIQP